MRSSLALVLLLIVVGCTKSCGRSEGELAAVVGDYKISVQDAALRDKVIQIYYPQQAEKYGLKQLVASYTYAQILKNYGKEITEDVVAGEAERIEKNTRAPEVLARIKAVFKDDEAAYRRVFILPTFADRVIYFDFFLKTPEFHAESKAKAASFARVAAAAPEKFASEAGKLGLSPAKLLVSLAHGLEWDYDKTRSAPPTSDAPAEVQKRLQEQSDTGVSQEGQTWMNDVIKPLKKGEVSLAPVERQEHWLVVRYLGPSKTMPGAQELESVSFPKADYEAWLNGERDKISIQMLSK